MAPSICSTSLAGSGPARKVVHAARIASSEVDAPVQSPDRAASKMSVAPAEIASSSAGVGCERASTGTASAFAS